ncbi:MAG TPA: hypothetical protein VNK50_14030 [Calidithermus sp.]|nr:hypothetical protein [Calidithermus sp.]
MLRPVVAWRAADRAGDSVERDALRRLIRRKLADGTLPRERALRVWAGRGAGERCAACDRAIGADQFLIEALRDDGSALPFHLECFYFWDALRHAPEGPAAGTGG